MNYESTVNAEEGEAPMDDMPDTDVGPQGSRVRTFLFIIAGLVILIGVGYFLLGGGQSDDAGSGQEQAPLVTVIAPGRTNIEGEIATTGTLAARRALPVGVAGEGGRVVSVPVDAGQWVNAGQVLAVIDRSVQSQQAASADAQVKVSKADANLAKANLDRALKLVERGFVSKADVDRLTATHDAAVARVNVAQAKARELRARNARLNIVAPSPGLILERNIEPGQVVGGGSGTLFLIAKGGEMELQANVGEIELANISVGIQAQVIPVGTDRVFTGQVWQISPVIDPQNRQGTARIALPYSPQLRPGGFASAIIKSGRIDAPLLPESAIQSDDTGSFVFVVGKDNKVVQRPVTTGIVTMGGIAIVEGLTGNEHIVLRAGGFLSPGELIKPNLVKADKAGPLPAAETASAPQS